MAQFKCRVACMQPICRKFRFSVPGESVLSAPSESMVTPPSLWPPLSCRCAHLQLADAGGGLLPQHTIDAGRQRCVRLAAQNSPLRIVNGNLGGAAALVSSAEDGMPTSPGIMITVQAVDSATAWSAWQSPAVIVAALEGTPAGFQLNCQAKPFSHDSRNSDVMMSAWMWSIMSCELQRTWSATHALSWSDR